MATPEQHIAHIRKTKFSIGGEENPLTEDLHHAVKNLAAELYAKDVHFLMEIIQNAEDNEYFSGVTPSLEFIITSRDITQTGALATLLIFNNEKGFSAKNIESICSVGRSTKKGNRKQGYIGEKGIGFKSVFLITSQPYIFSNGYKIRFNEKPCSVSNLGYIVPEWVEENPSLSDLCKIYGSGATLPATTIVLPLKGDKVKPVKEQLSSIHPEVLLFLTKIKKLSVKEDNEDPKLNSVSAVSISTEVNFVTRKNIDAESYTLHLAMEEKSTTFEKECSYYLWKQRFPVKKENRVDRRSEVEEWVITLAFPHGQRLRRGMTSPGVYAFLPTEMVTNFPFVIQADFLLASSREAILLDNRWNQGILGCVSTAFTDAFIAMVKTTVDAPISCLPPMFDFLPVDSSSYPELNEVRQGIRSKLVESSIVPCESYSDQKIFHKPHQIGRLSADFWDILVEARANGVNLANLSSHGRYILSCSFDQEKYDSVLNFLGVNYVNGGWYPKCIQSSNLVLGVSDDVYLELLVFVADNWSVFLNSNMKNVPLLKYVDYSGNVSLCSTSEAALQNGNRNLLISREPSRVAWLMDWNKEYGCLGDHFFLPKSTQEALRLSSDNEQILEWLKDSANVSVVTVSYYASLLLKSLGSDKRLAIAFVHFLSQSLQKHLMYEVDVKSICRKLPLLDDYGHVTLQRKGVLVPARGSKWVELIGSNPWREEGYIQLSEVYLNSGHFAGMLTSENQLLQFLITYVGASDIPDLSPPNAVIPTVAGPLTKTNALLLLEWIKNLKYNRFPLPERFLNSIKEGSWLRTSLSSSSGYRPPSQSFMFTKSCGSILQSGSVFVDIPMIDKTFYGEKILEYTDELRAIGVMSEYGEACEYIGNHLMSLATSSVLTKANVFSVLKFIKFLQDRMLPTDKFVNIIKKGRWMKTSSGYKSPSESVWYDHEWKLAKQISDISFVDRSYYGEEMDKFKAELQLLDVVVGFNPNNYQLVVDCLKDVTGLTSMAPEAFELILKCIGKSKFSEKLINAIKTAKVIKTNNGYKAPTECFLLNEEWGGLLQVFECFSLMDTQTYGSSILLFAKELKMIGVRVDFDDAIKAFTGVFKDRAASFSRGNDSLFGKHAFLLFLDSYKKLRSSSNNISELKKCIREVKWIRTRLGDYRSPKDCILFSSDWEPIVPITLLPFIDDNSYYDKRIHDYKDELKSLGVVINLKGSANFVADGLYLPPDPSRIASANVVCLLECIREHNKPLPDSFMKKVQKKWVKTNAGYRSPDKSLLFDSKWGSHLQQNDGPFIDMKFYGNHMMKYSQELNEIGVIVDGDKGGNLLYNHLYDHSDFTTIVRIYNYLNEVDWAPSNEDVQEIWIPDGDKNGKWVSPGECVLHDKDGLFETRLNVLEKHYDRKLLWFFKSSFDVKSNPSVEDYYMLWKDWESSGSGLTQSECCAFWGFMCRHCSSLSEKILANMFKRLPVNSVLDGILLVDKNDVFMADDLHLKDLLEQSSSTPLFVWFPQSRLPDLPQSKLLEIYRKIGVYTISESVVKEELAIHDGAEFKQVKPAEVFIGEVLIKVILSFLASASVNMEPENRHKAVSCLLNLTVLETVEPISVSYSLKLSTGKLTGKESRMIRLDKEKSKLFVQKMDKYGCFRNKIEYATNFSEVIAKGVLWEYEDHVDGLIELIKLCFLMEFNEDAVGFLLRSKNLLIYKEDEEFLSSAFSLHHGISRISVKNYFHLLSDLCDSSL